MAKSMTSNSSLFVKLDPADNVVVATQPLGLGSKVEGIAVLDQIPSGHKIAMEALQIGEPVHKYGQIIGYASQPVSPGQHVHLHNLEFRASNATHEVGAGVLNGTESLQEKRFFSGYQRDDGKTGTRNFIAILTSVNCSATAARQIAEHFRYDALQEFENVDGVAAFVHGTGCGLDSAGEGYANLQRVLWGYASHPNCGGVLLAGQV